MISGASSRLTRCPDSCRLRNRTMPIAERHKPLLLCLDPSHRRQLRGRIGSFLRLSGCPLQILQFLERVPRATILMDRCTAKHACCRRPLASLQRSIKAFGRRSSLDRSRSLVPGSPQHGSAAQALLSSIRASFPQPRAAPERKVTLKDLAGHFGVNPRQLNRLFQRAGCESPMREFRRLQLLEAYRRIRASCQSIEAIAEDFQFADRSSFARAFYRVFGFYPRKS